MNLLDSSFLCLDIGTTGVRGSAHRVRNARLDKSAVFATDSTDTVFALKSVIDELERQIGAHFDTAYITGNFGNVIFNMTRRDIQWNGEHKITPADIRTLIAQIPQHAGYYPMHIIPLQYKTPGLRYTDSPIGHTAPALSATFGAIFYTDARLDEITSFLRRAHIQAEAFYDPQFVLAGTLRGKDDSILLIDLGATYSTISMWTSLGPIMMQKIPYGGNNISQDIAYKLSIDPDDAERIKRAVASLTPQEMDRFTPADVAFDFSRADINDIVLPRMVEIAAQLKNAAAPAITKYPPARIILTGGGAEMAGCTEFIENAFGIPVKNMRSDGAMRALAAYIWNTQAPRRAAFLERAARNKRRFEKIAKLFRWHHKPRRAKFIPILPSTLCFNMKRPETYTTFQAGGISMIHVDIMDGFYVDRVASGIPELKMIRDRTDAHLHVHLMTESPEIWAADACAAGADTVIVSPGTAGVRNAIKIVRTAHKRIGVALNPDSDIKMLKEILRDLDEVMVMSVTPGAAGQTFDERALKHIAILDHTRRTFGLRLTISVDGGINNETAQRCWAAGADLLVSGSYLAHSPDFPLAVQSLLPAHNTNH